MMPGAGSIQTLFFDVGETLIDETRQWGEWADWLGVTRLTFFAALGAVIARGEHHRRVFEIVRPGMDLAREQAAREQAGRAYLIEPADVDHILSRTLGREVALVAEAPAAPTREADRSPIEQLASGSTIRQEPMALAAPSGTFFDYAVLHVLTTATIERLRELHPVGRVAIERFRPNIVAAPTGDERGFVENAWLGQVLTIGAHVQVQVIDPCPRCVVTTLAQGALPRDPGILRTLGQHNQAASVALAPGVVFSAVAGVYASVLREGLLRRGDAIRLR